MKKQAKHPKTDYFLEIFDLAERKYGKSSKRLAGEGWKEHWQTLISTIMSAQTRDEVTIPIAEALFAKYPTLEKLSKAKQSDVLKIIRSLNYSPTKAKHIILAAKYLKDNHDGKVPCSIEELILIPGVGRKTANLVITECHAMDGICVDTHVHRISNVLGIVNTKTPYETELELMKVAPKEYWSKINRIFVLWGKETPGNDAEKLLSRIKQ
ncbi:MAG TPA: endonuclease III [Alphaproteobacteria bacterium]|nr:endonuclease III [Alphaproteobacteria bacterium]